MAFSHINKFIEYILLGDVMFKRMMYKKIAVASTILFVMFMLYIIPSNQEEVEVSQNDDVNLENNNEAEENKEATENIESVLE